jgi:hypothetical protein
LNNSGDRLVLRDSSRLAIDSIVFKDTWGTDSNRSLERIHPEKPSNDPATWSSSASSTLSTPCSQNSIFCSSSPSRLLISANPDPFESETTISYQLSVPQAIVKLEVYDREGRLARRLIDQEVAGQAGSVIWDGRDEEGKRLRMGIYILYMEAVRSEMGVLDRVKSSVTIGKKLK